MIKRPMKYNPAFLSDQELIDSFVVRHKDLELVMQTIQENVGTSNQHILITGPRGIGKTMLLLRVAAEISNSKELSKIWYPLKFAEESYDVSTPGEFWLNAILRLAEQTGLPSWKLVWEELNEVNDENQLRERALAKLMDFADQTSKRIILIVENLNMLLGEQLSKDDAWKLRHTLQNEPRIMFLASAIKGFVEIEGIDRALFDAFIIHELQPLDEAQCRNIWMATTGKKVTDNRARPIQILTGGSPRLVKIISTFGVDLSFKELMADLTHLVDDHTDYFKSQIETLPPQERKVFVSLAELWNPSSTREVAKLARLNINKTSSLLNRLLGRGIVSLVDSDGRNKQFQVAERMFNIYYLMRSRGAKSRRVKAIVNFLIDFYGPSEIADRTRQIVTEAFHLAPEKRKDHYLAIEELLRNSSIGPMRDRILEEMPREFFNNPYVSEPLKNQFLERDLQVTNKKFGALITALKEIGDNKQGLETIEQNLSQAVHDFPNDPANWLRQGYFYAFHLKRFEEAEVPFQKAISVQPSNYIHWALLGVVQAEINERFEDAEEAIRKAIDLKSDLEWLWFLLGLILNEKMNRINEAEQAYCEALKINPKYDLAWSHLGQLLHEKTNRFEEAEKAYRKAIEYNPDNSWAWARLGDLLHSKLNRFAEAETAYRNAIELNPRLDRVWSQLAVLYYDKLERYSDAEKAFRKSLDLNPTAVSGWFFLALLLQDKLKRPGEAEVAYRKIIEMDQDNIDSYMQLFKLLLINREPQQEAMTFAKNALIKFSDKSEIFNSFAWSVYANKKFELFTLAEAWIKESLKIDPDNANYYHTYASILLVQDKVKDAFKAAERYLADPAVVSKTLSDANDLFIGFAARGYGKEALNLLRESPSAELLEPLLVGLQLYSGEAVKTAIEVKEIGKDVAKRIEERKQEMPQVGAQG